MIEQHIQDLGEAILEACFVYDNARSAEKMLDWGNLGNDNAAWTEEGPYLSAGANLEQINHEHPYCLRISKEFAMAGYLVLGDSPKQEENGGYKVPLSPQKNKHNSRVEPVIAKLAIIELFELYKQFLVSFNGPYNKKKLKFWESHLSIDDITKIKTLIDRRNELTHDKNSPLATMKEAVEYYCLCKELSKMLYNIHSNSFKNS
ncbi:hypothetical protein J3U35_05200 [Gilliamella sp. B2717]|uniref:hypothetical protein n=1 Tax=Gilliamella sp. B2717 TaxID=2817996 RepID=UPI002269FA50|nr:hypothetical protein [Gilliamella sp. B2717]MCX8578832.1 hypothetical protein [Gilliamella sp. B2717]